MRNPSPISSRASILETKRAHHQQRADRAHAAGTHGHAAVQGRIAHQSLEEQGQQGRGAIEHDAHHGHQQRAHGEVAVAEDADIDQRVLDPEFPGDQEDQRHAAR